MSEPSSTDNLPSTSQSPLKVPSTRRRSRKTQRKNIEWLYQTVPDEKAAVQFLREKGLLHSERLCPSCGQPMRPGRGGMAWRCFKRSCRKELSIRTGTWFSVPRDGLPVQKVVQLIYHWSRKHTTIKFCDEQLGITAPTAVRWCRYLRQAAADALATEPVQLGGPGMTVELDESLFSRSKYSRGRRYPGWWVFGGVCRTTRRVHLEVVEDRSSRTLLPTIQSHVKQESAVITDECRAYRSLGRKGYHHARVNHSANFVDPTTGAHTQTVESMWAQVKRGNKLRCGTHRSALPLHLSEFMWRKRVANGDPFDAILDVISRLHAPRQNEAPAPESLPQLTALPSDDVGTEPGGKPAPESMPQATAYPTDDFGTEPGGKPAPESMPQATAYPTDDVGTEPGGKPAPESMPQATARPSDDFGTDPGGKSAPSPDQAPQ